MIPKDPTVSPACDHWRPIDRACALLSDSNLPDPDNTIRASDDKLLRAGWTQEELMVMLDWFIHKNLFPADIKPVHECRDIELSQPLINESDHPVPERQHQFSPEKAQMITEEN